MKNTIVNCYVHVESHSLGRQNWYLSAGLLLSKSFVSIATLSLLCSQNLFPASSPPILEHRLNKRSMQEKD